MSQTSPQTTAQTAPYGSWKSPITAGALVANNIGVSSPRKVGDRHLWLESRPAEGGRSVVVERLPNGSVRDLLASGFDVRSRVHEYGGGAWTADPQRLIFVNNKDQRIYLQQGQQPPRALTPASDGRIRYADLHIDQRRKRLIAVRESHPQDGTEAVNSLVAVGLDSEHPKVETLASGSDFYASPGLSPDGAQLSWISWKHPNMPWDESSLQLATLTDDGAIATHRCIAGGAGESIFQPQWSNSGRLYFSADRSGWWNLYQWRDETVIPLHPCAAEFGLPQWVFGMSTTAICTDDTLVCAHASDGQWQLGLLSVDNAAWKLLTLPYCDISDLRGEGQRVVFRAASPDQAAALYELDIISGEVQLIVSSTSSRLDSNYISVAQALSYPSAAGETAHAIYYPPHNTDFQAPAAERPPLLVRSHGGPTAATSTAFNLAIQYWTSRGFAVLDVNYGGSTGYGRAYRQRLDGRWGQTDVDDCSYGARWLIERGWVDGQRCAIRGSSAGGYTTLATLTFRDLFQAGVSLYGIGDLETLASDTHKFESRYLDRLVGPYPEMRERYRERSPIHAVEQLSCPVLFLQGEEDRVVPPAQAEAMVAALKDKGLPVAYLAFANEQHGFRAAATIRAALEAELGFYGRVFGFVPADTLPDLVFENAEQLPAIPAPEV